MTISPCSSIGMRESITLSTILPAGTIIHTTRGDSNFETRSFMASAGSAPNSVNFFSGLRIHIVNDNLMPMDKQILHQIKSHFTKTYHA